MEWTNSSWESADLERPMVNGDGVGGNLGLLWSLLWRRRGRGI